jgi:hypothetical protein
VKPGGLHVFRFGGGSLFESEKESITSFHFPSPEKVMDFNPEIVQQFHFSCATDDLIAASLNSVKSKTPQSRHSENCDCSMGLRAAIGWDQKPGWVYQRAQLSEAAGFIAFIVALKGRI